jgi:hypothetical protein
MEELQDAIEDAQYMSAMHDEMPRPTKEWKWPGADELQAYLDKLKTVNPKIFTPEGFCKGSLGFYLVRKFLIPVFATGCHNCRETSLLLWYPLTSRIVYSLHIDLLLYSL